MNREVNAVNIRIGKLLAAGIFGATLSLGAFAQHGDRHVKEDIVRHRAMAAAHEAAAKCLESGKKPEVCLGELQASCKGLGIGKYCGMKHEH